jgi:hypothetical protein
MRLQNADHRDGGTENVQAAVIGGDWLVMTRTGMEEGEHAKSWGADVIR